MAELESDSSVSNIDPPSWNKDDDRAAERSESQYEASLRTDNRAAVRNLQCESQVQEASLCPRIFPLSPARAKEISAARLERHLQFQ